MVLNKIFHLELKVGFCNGIRYCVRKATDTITTMLGGRQTSCVFRLILITKNLIARNSNFFSLLFLLSCYYLIWMFNREG